MIDGHHYLESVYGRLGKGGIRGVIHIVVRSLKPFWFAAKSLEQLVPPKPSENRPRSRWHTMKTLR